MLEESAWKGGGGQLEAGVIQLSLKLQTAQISLIGFSVWNLSRKVWSAATLQEDDDWVLLVQRKLVKLCGCFSASVMPSVMAAAKWKVFLVHYQCVIASLTFLPSPLGIDNNWRPLVLCQLPLEGCACKWGLQVRKNISQLSEWSKTMSFSQSV